MFKKIANKNIIKTVENHFGLKNNSIISNIKSTKTITARYIAMYLSKKLLNYSYGDIASIYSKDITVTLHDISPIESQMKSNTKFNIVEIIHYT